MKIKQYFIMLLIVLMVSGISVFADVPPAPTFNTPAASDRIGGTGYLVNTTVGGVGSGDSVKDLFNLTLWAQSTLTANSTPGIVATANLVNFSRAGGLNVSISTTQVEDANNYIFTIQVVNHTVGNGSARNNGTVSSVVVDNTIPQAATSLSPTTAADGSATSSWSATVVGVNTTSCTLLFTDTYGIQTSYGMTHSSDSCTSTQVLYPASGSTWFVRTSDATNTTDSAVTTLTVSKDGGGGAVAVAMAQQQAAQLAQQQQTQSTNSKNVVIVLLLGGGALWYFIKGGRRKK